MPELPEVETIARKLRATIPGKRICEVRLSGKSLRRPMPAALAAHLQGRLIRSIERRGKYLILEMDPHAFWLIHLGMSGRLFLSSSPAERPRHTHATIRFTDGWEMQYRDPRRFGLMDLSEAASLSAVPEIQRLGRDPLSREFREAWLAAELAQSRREIKAFLLDQRKIAGLGNIYACEALFHARLHPQRRCHTVTREEAAALARAIRAILKAAIENHGTTFSDFVGADGEPGAHQDFLQVFQREGKRCHRCRASILRVRQGNRSSYYCPGCQDVGPGATRKKG